MVKPNYDLNITLVAPSDKHVALVKSTVVYPTQQKKQNDFLRTLLHNSPSVVAHSCAYTDN